MSKKILVVDDEQDCRDYLETFFLDNGYEVEVAHDGEDGLYKLKEFFPDLITLDIVMPNQTGVGFFRKLRKSDILQDIPVIILSGATRYKEFFSNDHVTMPRPEAFFEKPFDMQELIDKVKELII